MAPLWNTGSIVMLLIWTTGVNMIFTKGKLYTVAQYDYIYYSNLKKRLPYQVIIKSDMLGYMLPSDTEYVF